MDEYADIDTYIINDNMIEDPTDSDYSVLPAGEDVYLPDEETDLPKITKKERIATVSAVKEMLKNAGEEMGVPITEHMESNVIAMTAARTVNVDSMLWFLSGYLYHMNNNTKPEMESLVRDMRSEVKNMQSVSHTLKTASKELSNKLTGVKGEIVEEMNKLKDNLFSVFEDMSATIRFPSTNTNTVNLRGPMTEKMSYPSAPQIKDLAESIRAPIPAVDPSSMIRSTKRKLLVKLNLPDHSEAIPDSLLDDVITDSEAALYMGSDDSLEDLFTPVITRLVSMNLF